MPRRTTPHVSEAVEQFIRIRSTYLAAQTCINDRSLLNRLVRVTGDPQVHLLNPGHIEDYFAALREQKPRSWNKERSRLATFFAWCTKRGWVTTDLLQDIHPRRVIREQRLQLTAEQLVRLHETPDPRDRAVIALAANTGLRAASIASLRVRDVDLGQGLLAVFISKSGFHDRLPITSDLDRELRRWLVAYQADIGRPLAPEDYLVPSRGTRRRQYADGRFAGLAGDLRPEVPMVKVASVVKRQLERQLGITDVTGEGIHTIRRSVARLLFEEASSQGHDSALRVTAALLGHSSTAVTEVYLGIDRDRAKRDELLRGRSLFAQPAANVIPLRKAE